MARRDLSPFGLSKSVVRKLEKEIGHADLTAAADNQDISCGTLPTGSVVLGWEVKISQAFDSADAADTWDLDDIKVGGVDLGTENLSLDAAGTSTLAVMREADGAVLANIEITPNVANNVDAATAGALTLKIFYVEVADALVT